jgi:hypothetical protein
MARFSRRFIVVVRLGRWREVWLAEVVLLLHLLLLHELLLLLLQLHRVQLRRQTQHTPLHTSGAAHAHAHTRPSSRLFGYHHLVLGAVRVADAILCDCAHFAGYPAGEDLAALFLAEAGAVEVAFDDERDDVDDELVFV